MQTSVTKPGSSRVLWFSLLAVAASSLLSMSAYADTLSMGAILPNYAVVSVGPNASVTVNSGPITGNVLIGDQANATSSGGGNGQVTGVVNVDGTQTGDNLQNLQNKPTVVSVAPSVGTQAFTDADNLSAAASGLTPTETLAGTISSATTFNGDGGLNVIDINSIQNAPLTIHGSASDIFVFNVSGTFNTNVIMTLQGVTASQILWNLTGTTGNIFQTSGGDVLYGTFLATHGGNFQFSNLDLTGELINTDGHMQIVSGSKIVSNQPFTGMPEPSSLLLLGIGITVGGFCTRRWRRKTEISSSTVA